MARRDVGDVALFSLNPAHGVVQIGYEIAGYAGHEGVEQAGHHEGVVEQILADHRGAGAVEVDRGDV